MCAVWPTIRPTLAVFCWAPAPDRCSFRRTVAIRGSLFAHLGPGDDYVLDHIIFDPAHPATIYVAGWSLYNADEGDVFRSDDGGHTWRDAAGRAWQVGSRHGHGAQRSQHCW